MNFISKIIEPRRLLVVWQSLQDNCGTGKRYVVGELSHTGDSAVLQYNKDSEDFKRALELGFKGYAIFNPDQASHTHNVWETLSHRIPSRQRGDFNDFLRYYRITPEAGACMTDFALLGYTSGRLPGDGVTFVHTFENATPPCEITIEVAGARHYKEKFGDLGKLTDRELVFVAEPNNAHDAQAVVIKTKNDEETVGYVNRAQTGIFNQWLRNNVQLKANVERVNGSADRPNMLMYVQAG